MTVTAAQRNRSAQGKQVLNPAQSHNGTESFEQAAAILAELRSRGVVCGIWGMAGSNGSNGQQPPRQIGSGLFLSKQTTDMLLKVQKKLRSDAIALLVFYHHTALWQCTNQPKATVSYVSKALGWSSLKKVCAVRKVLLDLGLIEKVRAVDPRTGKVIGHYVKVAFFQPMAKTSFSGAAKIAEPAPSVPMARTRLAKNDNMEKCPSNTSGLVTKCFGSDKCIIKDASAHRAAAGAEHERVSASPSYPKDSKEAVETYAACVQEHPDFDSEFDGFYPEFEDCDPEYAGCGDLAFIAAFFSSMQRNAWSTPIKAHKRGPGAPRCRCARCKRNIVKDWLTACRAFVQKCRDDRTQVL